ncbi:MAG: hypothetical protein ABR573_11945 [Candidatus Dormibacteria bacterium]
MSRHALIGVATALLLAACGGVGASDPTGLPQTSRAVAVADSPELPVPAGATAQVTYQDRAVVLDRSTWKKDVRAISSDQTTYTLDASSAAAGKLRPGMTLFLYGRALRKVTGVKSQGGQVVVTTENAAITDLVKDGSIKWNQPVDVTKGGFVSGSTTSQGPNGRQHTAESPSPGASPGDAVATPDPGSASPDPGAATPDPAAPTPEPSPVAMSNPRTSMVLTWPDGQRQSVGFNLAGAPAVSDVDGYKLAAEYTVVADRVDLKLTASKDFGAGTVSLEAKGFIKNFQQSTSIEIRSGAVESFSQQSSNVSAAMTVSWLSKKEGPGQMASTTILKPQVSYNLPFSVAGIPMFVEIGANAALIPAFSSQGTAKASFTLSYQGNEGVDFSRGKVGGTDTHSGNFEIKDSKITSPAIVSMTSLISFPKLTLGLGWRQPGLSFSDSVKGVSAAGWVDLLLTMSSITTGLDNAGTGTSCIKTLFSVAGRTGLEFKVLGIDLPTQDHDPVWRKKATLTVPEGSPLCAKVAMPE